MRRSITAFAAGLVTAVTVLGTAYADEHGITAGGSLTATPIKHLVVIFRKTSHSITIRHLSECHEPGEPRFEAAPAPVRERSDRSCSEQSEFESSTTQTDGATNPFRLDRSEAATNDQDHNYTPSSWRSIMA